MGMNACVQALSNSDRLSGINALMQLSCIPSTGDRNDRSQALFLQVLERDFVQGVE